MEAGSTPVNKLESLLLLFDFSVEFFESTICFSKIYHQGQYLYVLEFLVDHLPDVRSLLHFFLGPLSLTVMS